MTTKTGVDLNKLLADDKCIVVGATVYSSNGIVVEEVVGYSDDSTQAGEMHPMRTGHYYAVSIYNLVTKELNGAPTMNCSKTTDFVQFQDGAIPLVGLNGLTNEVLLAILIHRTLALNAQLPCDENEVALVHLGRALDVFHERAARQVREREAAALKKPASGWAETMQSMHEDPPTSGELDPKRVGRGATSAIFYTDDGAPREIPLRT